jgi:two-component system phosphate regulon response regulator PhoB
MAKILLVEDDAQTVELIQFILEPKGHALRIVASGALALAQAREFKPDLILLDVMLPGLDGASVQTQMLEDPDLKTIPIIMLTAKADLESRFRGASNVAFFLSKPFAVKELVEKINAALAPR